MFIILLSALSSQHVLRTLATTLNRWFVISSSDFDRIALIGRRKWDSRGSFKFCPSLRGKRSIFDERQRNSFELTKSTFDFPLDYLIVLASITTRSINVYTYNIENKSSSLYFASMAQLTRNIAPFTFILRIYCVAFLSSAA